MSRALEKQNYPAEDVAMFLMRCLFTMFAEDVGLLPEKALPIKSGGAILLSSFLRNG